MRKLNVITIVILCVAFLGSASEGFDKQVNFSGTWSIDKTKTDFGSAPEYVLPRSFKIDQLKDMITIERVLLDGQLTEHPLKEILPFSEVPVETVTYTGGKRNSILKWNEDHNGFELSTKSMAASGAPGLIIKETWTLRDDGKMLSIERYVEQPNGQKYTIKGYYDKK